MRGPRTPLSRVCACALLLVGCDAYDAMLLREPSHTPKDAGHNGMVDGGVDAGDGGGQCVYAPETCNAIDDDCDGRIDEQTLAYCESIIVNAETKCVPVGSQGAPQAACVQLRCLTGFDDCDGQPQNGCEKPFCQCNDCGDAGEDTDAGG